jgi:hypothetical protein
MVPRDLVVAAEGSAGGAGGGGRIACYGFFQEGAFAYGGLGANASAAPGTV